MVQLSHPCMTTGKTIVLTIWTFVGKGPKGAFQRYVSKGTFKSKNSLVAQWSGLHSFTAMGLGLIPGQGTKNAQTRRCRRKKKLECMVSKSCNSRGKGLGDCWLYSPSVENWLVLPLSGLRLSCSSPTVSRGERCQTRSVYFRQVLWEKTAVALL